jgi:hypothetical protein
MHCPDIKYTYGREKRETTAIIPPKTQKGATSALIGCVAPYIGK